jgi:hypothetical protein
MEEIWKNIKGYEGFYQVSNKGRIKRLAGKCLAKAGKYRNVAESILTNFPNKTRGGYLYINLNNNGIKQFRVHRLVAIHFISNPNNLSEVNHIDCDKTNNNDWNLEWCTNQENMDHAIKNNLFKPRFRTKAPNVKLTEEQVKEIKNRLNNKECGRHIAKDFNISEGMISLIKHNKNWKE